MTQIISVRVSPKVKAELDLMVKEEKFEQTSEAARKVLAMGLEEWRKERALSLFNAKRVTLSKGAALAQMNVWDFSDLIKERGTQWIKEKRFIERDLARGI